MIKKIVIGILKVIGAFIAFVLIYLLAAFVLSSITVNKVDTAADEIEVYLLSNGVHSDIVMPTISEQMDWFSKFDFLAASIDTSDYKYIAIGWGDKGFYLNTPTWAELKVSTALKATVGISGTAIHATYYKDMQVGERCRKLSLSKDQYAKLMEYVFQSLELGQNGVPIKIITTANKGKFDAFYEAKGRYNIFKTCNSWTNRGLKAADQRACLWTAFVDPILSKYAL